MGVFKPSIIGCQYFQIHTRHHTDRSFFKLEIFDKITTVTQQMDEKIYTARYIYDHMIPNISYQGEEIFLRTEKINLVFYNTKRLLKHSSI